MELLLQIIPIFLLLIISIIIIIIFSPKRWAQGRKKPGRQLAPAPGWRLPVIGHLHHFLTSRQPPHRLLRELSRKHGDVIRLELGEISHVLISSAEAAMEVMRTHDVKFAQRPPHPHYEKVVYGGMDLIQAPYGDYWRQLRRIATLELLTAKRVRSLRRVREAEVRTLVASIAASSPGATIDLTRMLFSFTYNVMYRIISMSTFGDVSRGQEEFIKVAEKLVEYAGGFKVAYLFPSNALVQMLSGTEEFLDGIQKVVDGLAESMIEQHQARRAAQEGKSRAEEEEEDLLDVLLNLQENDTTLGFRLSTDAVKGFLLDIFLAGSETPAALIEWTMSELIKNPEVMYKAQSEVRRVFGGKGRVEEAGICELAYLKLVIKETLRLHTPAPLVLPRECREECRISGYDIPLKTRILVNAWAIARDPRYWGEEAEKFMPERFLNNKVSFRGGDFEFLPFGAGRRMCPGMTFGLAAAELPLASLLFHFDWELPRGVEPTSFNMDEKFGVTLRRENHLELIPVVRYNPLPSI
ncbi:unnamed protein product [Linum tenue]|uniref:Cytochrome P450 n=1 Tax=Linum tenue TaxID=586396 RepID=A0AAV0JL97_9ROSI|nr:unnamed protein product [Linum tenue]